MQSVSWAGQSWSLPQNREPKGVWGAPTAAFLAGLAAYAIPKTGGAQALTAEMDFGATYGIVLPYVKSSTANAATGGVVRFANNEGMKWRNSTPASADLELKVNSSNALTFEGATLASTALKLSAFAATTSAELKTVISDETGSGALVFATSPTLVTPVLGTPASGTLTNCLGLPIAGITGLGTGIDSLLATPSSANLKAAITDETGSGALVFATSPTLVTPLLGTPTSGTLTNCTGLPVSSGISGLAANVATFLATPSSANLLAAVTDETGTGALVFATSPTFVTPVLGAASATSLSLANGSAAAPPLFFAGALTSGLYRHGADSLGFAANGLLGGFIANSGAWQIGRTGASAGTLEHIMYGNSSSDPVFRVMQERATADSAGILAGRFASDADCTGGYFFYCENSSGTTIGRIEAASNTTTSFTGTSDQRLKRVLGDFDGMDILMRIESKMAEWISNPGKGYPMMLAQQLHTVAPYAVSVGDDRKTEDGSLKNPWGTDPGKLVPVIVRAIQQFKASVDQVKASMDARLRTIESRLGILAPT